MAIDSQQSYPLDDSDVVNKSYPDRDFSVRTSDFRKTHEELVDEWFWLLKKVEG